MGYARHIGRVGALAVTLGVGVAIATTPGIAYSDSTGSSTSTGDSSSTSTSSSTGTSAAGTEGASTDGSDGTDASATDLESTSDSDDESTSDTDIPADDDTAEGVEGGEGGDAEEPTGVGGDEDTPPANAAPAEDDDSVQGSASGDSAAQQLSSESASAHVSDLLGASDRVDSTVDEAAEQSAESGPQQLQSFRVAAEDDAPETFSLARSSADALTSAATTLTSVPQQRPTLVSVVTDFVAAVLNPFLSSGTGSPIQIPILSAMLLAVRNEFERILAPRTTKVASQQTISQLVDPTDQHVLVIGVDGANLSRILALDDTQNENFRELMSTSTNSAPSIVGHTTLSNPSWTAILTGEWGEKTGVINNVFTPWTYDKYPTVFNQLETLDSDIDTMTVANWDVINAISGAGSIPVDENLFVAQIEGDTNWLETDDKVADLTVDAISDVEGAPNFLFSYYVGVDENGHMYGGGSEEYKLALENMDDNLGEIMDAVDAWEAAHPGEEWTIVVVTDHGHQSAQGFGHGFQTPNETATFVIADGPAFQDGDINLEYEIVDTTPTVVALFGGEPKPGSDGVTLMSLSGSDVDPGDFDDLRQALEDQLASNHEPGPITNLALTLRTIFGSVPYFVYNFGLPSPIHDVLYIATNVPAQIVAFLTGVRGASIFPLAPPPRPDFPPAEDSMLQDSTSIAV